MTATATATRRHRWQWNEWVHESTRITICAILWTLHDLGGGIRDENGRCASSLIAAAKKNGTPVHPTHQGKAKGIQAMSTLLRELDGGRYGQAITRRTHGKRTYEIRLNLALDEMPPRPLPVVTRHVEDHKPNVPAQPIPRPQVGDTRPASVFRPTVDVTDPTAGGDGPPPEPVPEPGPGPDVPEPQPAQLVVADPPAPAPVEPTMVPLVVVDSDDPIDILLRIQQLSMSAVLSLAAGPTETTGEPAVDPDEKNAQAKRLAATLEENNRLRSKVNAHAETINAKTKEAAALRKALTVAQSNLKALQDAANASPGRERALARLNGNQRFIAAKPEPAIAGRRQA
jgi:hypothetical protein